MDVNLEPDFLRVTERAAIAAARTMGYGERKHSDKIAVEAMRREMDTLAINGTIVIGEGERDKAPMLYVGEKVGADKDGSLGQRSASRGPSKEPTAQPGPTTPSGSPRRARVGSCTRRTSTCRRSWSVPRPAAALTSTPR
jgi:hypothetical protein